VTLLATPEVNEDFVLYLFVCILRARQRTQNTHKQVLQRMVAAGDPPVQSYCPYSPGEKDSPTLL